MRKLDEIREKVSGQSISVKDAIGFYTNSNALNFDVIRYFASESSNSELGSAVSAYVNFLEGKERAGIERAVLSNAFAADEFTEGVFSQFISLTTAQDTYFDVFKSFAQPGQVEFFNQKMSDPVVAEVQRIRDIAIAAENESGAIARLQIEMGYGGAIHQFKNYVLRGQQKYADRFNQKYALINEITDGLTKSEAFNEHKKESLANNMPE